MAHPEAGAGGARDSGVRRQVQRGVGAAHPPVVGGDGVGLLLGGGVAVVGVRVDTLLDDGDGLPPLGEAADASFPA